MGRDALGLYSNTVQFAMITTILLLLFILFILCSNLVDGYVSLPRIDNSYQQLYHNFQLFAKFSLFTRRNKSTPVESIQPKSIQTTNGTTSNAVDNSYYLNYELTDRDKQLIDEKLKQWRILKEQGKLQELGKMEEVFEEDIDELDESIQHSLLNDKNYIKTDSVEKNEVYEMKEKMLNLKGNSLGMYSLMNEMKDKKILDPVLFQEVLMNMARIFYTGNETSYCGKAFQLYSELFCHQMNEKEENQHKQLMKQYHKTCSASNMTSIAHDIQTKFKNQYPLEYQELDFLPSQICLSLHNNQGSVIQKQLDVFSQNLKKFDVQGINLVIRILGRYRRTNEIFHLFDRIRQDRIVTNSETIEFLANSIVVSVGKGMKADTMKYLPKTKMSVPEIIFIGRSNVGKSSLVNFLLNRKALAPTSPTPGFTQHFHFFPINEDRVDVPSFAFVDVPGLGYAETVDENRQVSWRSLLQRYMARRSSLRLVCHLIDSRMSKLTATDKEIFELVSKSYDERMRKKEVPFKYVMILTKVDKVVNEKSLNTTIENIRNYIEELQIRTEFVEENAEEESDEIDDDVNDEEEKSEIVAGSRMSDGAKSSKYSILRNAEILTTSSTNKLGADKTWKYFQEAINKS